MNREVTDEMPHRAACLDAAAVNAKRARARVAQAFFAPRERGSEIVPIEIARYAYLRLTELSRDKRYEKLCNPRSAGSAKVGRRVPVAKVLNGNGECWRCGSGSSSTDYPVDVQREIIGGKSKPHDFRGKRKLVATGEHITPATTTKRGLSLFAEAQVHWICCWCDLPFFHDDLTP